jgi:uncharacterized protein (DUF433 family)
MAAAVDIGGLISRHAEKHGGRPYIAGVGMSVGRIAVLHNQGFTAEEIVADYQDLSLAQVHAALAYYYSNRAEIDRDLEVEEKLYDELAREQRRQP